VSLRHQGLIRAENTMCCDDLIPTGMATGYTSSLKWSKIVNLWLAVFLKIWPRIARVSTILEMPRSCSVSSRCLVCITGLERRFLQSQHPEPICAADSLGLQLASSSIGLPQPRSFSVQAPNQSQVLSNPPVPSQSLHTLHACG
jgi:hypothetical protein